MVLEQSKDNVCIAEVFLDTDIEMACTGTENKTTNTENEMTGKNRGCRKTQLIRDI